MSQHGGDSRSPRGDERSRGGDQTSPEGDKTLQAGNLRSPPQDKAQYAWNLIPPVEGRNPDRMERNLLPAKTNSPSIRKKPASKAKTACRRLMMEEIGL
jgi:hypothetical protein